MILFINNNMTKFCQITLRVLKDLFIKEKWFPFLPHGVHSINIADFATGTAHTNDASSPRAHRRNQYDEAQALACSSHCTDVAASVATCHHRNHCGKMCHHPQNRKYITYRSAAREGPSPDHR